MPHSDQACQILDSGLSVRNKALDVKPSWEEEFWEKFHHKHKQVFSEVKEMLHLEVTEVEEVMI